MGLWLHLAGHKVEVFGELQDLQEATLSLQLAGAHLGSLLGLQGSLLLLPGRLQAGSGTWTAATGPWPRLLSTGRSQTGCCPLSPPLLAPVCSSNAASEPVP